MRLFYVFFTIIILQRLCEVIIAKRNEKWMRERGAQEFGQDHYPLIVFIHTMFFIVFFLEVYIWHNRLSPVMANRVEYFYVDPVNKGMGTHFIRKVLEYKNHCIAWGKNGK